MASIQKRGKKYRVQIAINGVRENHTFDSKTEASMFVLQREAEIKGKKLPSKSLADAFAKYVKDVSPGHKGERWEMIRLKALSTHDVAKKKISNISTADMSAWRDERLKSVSAATVLREINLINSVFESARRDWQWIRENPLKDMRKPKAPPSRKRRVTQAEIKALIKSSGYAEGAHPQDLTQLCVVAFLFAIETAMRSGEILAIEWANVTDYSVVLPRTKNGDSREVPLSAKAKELLGLLTGAKPFPIATGTRDALFRRLVINAGLPDLHFHDARSEAIFRLSKKLDILELARMVGHRDLGSLMIYYRASAQELAAKL